MGGRLVFIPALPAWQAVVQLRCTAPRKDLRSSTSRRNQVPHRSSRARSRPPATFLARSTTPRPPMCSAAMTSGDSVRASPLPASLGGATCLCQSTMSTSGFRPPSTPRRCWGSSARSSSGTNSSIAKTSSPQQSFSPPAWSTSPESSRRKPTWSASSRPCKVIVHWCLWSNEDSYWNDNDKSTL